MATIPTWAVTGGAFTVHAIGDAFAVIKPDAARTSDPAVDGTASVIEFRDAATGDGRGTASSPVTKTWEGTWRGRPALYVAFQRVQVSDGLSAERREQVVTAYGANGTQLGTVGRALGSDHFAVVNGWVVTEDANKQGVTVADLAGSVRAALKCTSTIACAVDVDLDGADLVEGSSRLPIVVGDLAFGTERINSPDRINPLTRSRGCTRTSIR